MTRRLRPLAWLALLLAPSAYFAWRYRDMPQFGEWHDDSLYFVAAKSLAAGSGYRNLSLPGEPYQTKYPPLYPLWLSLVWKINPSFPDNLTLATWFSWIMMPGFLFGSWLLYRRFGFSEARAGLLTAMLAVNIYAILFSTRLLSELPFSVLLLAGLLLCERALSADRAWQWALAAGAAGALALLTRSAGVALLVSGFAAFWGAKRRGHAMIFAAPMVAAFAGWTLWAQLHQDPASDILSIYHSSYLRYQILNIAWSDYPLFVWKNLDQLLYGAGALILPKITDALPVKILTQTVGIAMIAGVVRLRGNPGVRRYAGFAVVNAALLLVWHFPPNERFVFPLFPLLLAGLAAEISHLAGLLRPALHHPAREQRIAGWGFAAGLAGLAVAVAGFQAAAMFLYYPEVMRDHQRRTARNRAAYRWIAEHVPPAANLLAYNDPTLYLYAHRRACSLTLPPVYWYHGDHASIRRSFAAADAFAREHGIEYALVTPSDGHRDMEDSDRLAALRILARHPAFHLIAKFGDAALYRISRTRSAGPS
jgi:hypothetical protein